MSFYSAPTKFGSLQIIDTNRQTRNGKPMLDYHLTNSTDEFPLGAISFNRQIMAESEEIGRLSAGLAEDTFEKSSEVVADLKKIIKNEGSTWSNDPRWIFSEDLSKRQHLLEGSEPQIIKAQGESVTWIFSKPQK